MEIFYIVFAGITGLFGFAGGLAYMIFTRPKEKPKLRIGGLPYVATINPKAVVQPSKESEDEIEITVD